MQAIVHLALMAALSFAPVPRPRSPQLLSAFAAAVGSREPVEWTVQEASAPPGSNASGLIPGPVTLEVIPESLVPLKSGGYALILAEIDRNPSHATPGAIAVAYLRRTGPGWTLDHLWKEVTWSGADGRPLDRLSRLGFGAVPMIAASYTDGRQGQYTAVAWVIALTSAGPQRLGSALIGGDDTPGRFTCCASYAYNGRIGPPRHAGALLSITYKGWTKPELSSRRRVPVFQIVDYAEDHGTLHPRRKLRLPGLDN